MKIDSDQLTHLWARFDNGEGAKNVKGDQILADAEIRKGGGYLALSEAIEALPLKSQRLFVESRLAGKEENRQLVHAAVVRVRMRFE